MNPKKRWWWTGVLIFIGTLPCTAAMIIATVHAVRYQALLAALPIAGVIGTLYITTLTAKELYKTREWRW